MMYIKIISFSTREKRQAEKIIALYEFVDKNKYALTSDSQKADIILVTDCLFDNYGEIFWKNELIKKHLNKCFILSNTDKPFALFRGILTAGEQAFNFNRIRTCSYNSLPDHFKNVFFQYPLKEKDDSKRNYLFSFIGRNCNNIREKLFGLTFQRKDILLEDTTKTFNLYEQDGESLQRQKYYFDQMLNSKFAICPGGWGTNSYRLFEAMSVGVAPVIISDKFVLPAGPDWKECSIILKESEIHQLEQKVAAREHDFVFMGKKAREAYDKYFRDEVFFDYIVENCIAIKKKQVIPEAVFYHIITPLYMRFLRFKNGRYISIRNGLQIAVNDPLFFLKKQNREKVGRFLRRTKT